MYVHTYTWHYITSHYTTLPYIALHYITWHYRTLHYITLNYITLHTVHTYTYIYNTFLCVLIHACPRKVLWAWFFSPITMLIHPLQWPHLWFPSWPTWLTGAWRSGNGGKVGACTCCGPGATWKRGRKPHPNAGTSVEIILFSCVYRLDSTIYHLQ